MKESEGAHPGKMHIYNMRGLCWCGAHRDDGLAEAICEVLTKRKRDDEEDGGRDEQSQRD